MSTTATTMTDTSQPTSGGRAVQSVAGRSPPRRRRGAHDAFLSLEPIPEDASKDFTAEDVTPVSVVRSIAAEPNSIHDSVSSVLDLDQLVLVNQDRRFHGLDPFRSSKYLNNLASLHVSSMARKMSVFHSVSCIEELIARLSNVRVAENVQRGDGIVEMHEDTMHKPGINRSNILSTKFNEFGSAVALGEDGKLYACQLFRADS